MRLRWLDLSMLLAALPSAAAAQTAPSWFATAAGDSQRLELALPDGSIHGLGLAADTAVRRAVALGDGRRVLLSGTAASGGGTRPWVAVAETTSDDSRQTLSLRELPAPPVRDSWHGGDAEPLVAGGELRALAWLELRQARGQEVRVARWLGDRWDRAETVAPAAAGSQLALTAITPADGATILAWSRFDGSDDEIVWTRFAAERWSEPQAASANDRRPDITPSLALLPDGTPILAWAQYDGSDYRIQLARWTGSGFAQPRQLGGRGGGRPLFLAGGGRLALQFWDTERDAWVVAELDPSGAPRRSATIRGAASQRPLATLGEAGVTVSGAAPAGWSPWQD